MSARTVSERDERLGKTLIDKLRALGLSIDREQRRADYAHAYQLVEALVLEVRADDLLEQLAEEHPEITPCELRQLPDGDWTIIRPSSTDPLQIDPEPLATGDTPLEAVEELRRDLELESFPRYEVHPDCGCSGCPFEVGLSKPKCTAPGTKMASLSQRVCTYGDSGAPEWCPLRRGPVLVG
jgi:hypothetical protein